MTIFTFAINIQTTKERERKLEFQYSCVLGLISHNNNNNLIRISSSLIGFVEAGVTVRG